ncbi:hypothetical protein MIDIC_170032 [Alphaproteobacteria bacterium]
MERKGFSTLTTLGIGKCFAIQLVSFLPEFGDKSYIGKKQGRDLFVGKKNSKKRGIFRININ